MTNRELIALLSTMPPDLEVWAAHPYEDNEPIESAEMFKQTIWAVDDSTSERKTVILLTWLTPPQEDL